jgi:hypothetical protein
VSNLVIYQAESGAFEVRMDGDLDHNSVCAKSAHTVADGKPYQVMAQVSA